MPPLGIESIKEIIETVALVLGAAAIIWGIRTYRVTHNQFNFAVITSCIARFQAIFPLLRSPNASERRKAIKQYIDLCNEELFYFKNNYVPDEVVDEWIEGMIYYLPWFDESERNLNGEALPEIISENLLAGYPRIQQAFKVDKRYNLSSLGERMALVRLVKQNIKNPSTSGTFSDE